MNITIKEIINNNEPIYTCKIASYVDLYNGNLVPKSFHDFVWEQAVGNIAKMNPGSDLEAADVLDFGVYDYLSEDEKKAVGICLEHWAMLNYFPITYHGRDEDGVAQFTVNDKETGEDHES